MIKGLGRIVIAVRDMERALEFYRDALGLPVDEERQLVANNLKLVRLRAGTVVLELIQPIGEVGPVADFLRTSGEGLHHLSFEVDDIDLEMSTLLARGVQLFEREARPTPAGRTAFVQPRSAGGVLIELNETAAPSTGDAKEVASES